MQKLTDDSDLYRLLPGEHVPQHSPEPEVRADVPRSLPQRAFGEGELVPPEHVPQDLSHRFPVHFDVDESGMIVRSRAPASEKRSRG